MHLLKHDNSSGSSLFQLELSSRELIVYESCLYYVLNHCPEELLYDLVGCEDKPELKIFQESLLRLLLKYADKELLPKRYFEKKYREYVDYD